MAHAQKGMLHAQNNLLHMIMHKLYKTTFKMNITISGIHITNVPCTHAHKTDEMFHSHIDIIGEFFFPREQTATTQVSCKG